jgi:hypothetical protein
MISSKQMAQAGAMYGLIDGEFLTLRELMIRERGREVSDNEALNFCIRHRKQDSRIASFINYAKQHKHA